MLKTQNYLLKYNVGFSSKKLFIKHGNLYCAVDTVVGLHNLLFRPKSQF